MTPDAEQPVAVDAAKSFIGSLDPNHMAMGAIEAVGWLVARIIKKGLLSPEDVAGAMNLLLGELKNRELPDRPARTLGAAFVREVADSCGLEVKRQAGGVTVQ